MTLKNLDKAPFPWFGGKSQAADTVWSLLGDVPHYVEPFFGGGAVLLRRPHPCNRPYVSETVNDIDGLVVNFWRAVAYDPEATAHAASWPVTELDKQARQIRLQQWVSGEARDRLAGDATWYDPVMAGWWAWALSVQIGAIGGPWTADPVTGRITKAGGREPGVSRDLPAISKNGQGVNHQGGREPGVSRSLPDISNDGKGVNHAGGREPGVLDPVEARHGRSALDDWGSAYHDLAMPEVVRWFRHLAARLRHVRVLNGDWARLVTTGATLTLPVRSGAGPCGVFLDPPYADTASRADGLYACDSLTVAHDVRAWCLEHGDDARYRIVLAGFDGEHGDALTDAGWTVHEWFDSGHLRGGFGDQQHRERLWASPHCLSRRYASDSLFGGAA
jgi:hypothetical protein